MHTWHIYTNFICKTIGLLVIKVVMHNWQSYETDIFQLLSSSKHHIIVMSTELEFKFKIKYIDNFNLYFS